MFSAKPHIHPNSEVVFEVNVATPLVIHIKPAQRFLKNNLLGA